MNTKPTQNMMLISSNWGPVKTFNLIPTDINCPYVEALYNPQGKVLAIIGKNKKETFHQVPRLDDNGEPLRKKGASNPEKPYKMQRISQETYSEYYITNEKEIEKFIETFAINEKEFDYKQFLNMETMDSPNDKKVLEPNLIIK
jgi:hypothetical protein